MKNTRPKLRARAHSSWWVNLLTSRILHHLVTLRPKLKEGLGLNVKSRNIAVNDRFPDHTERRLGPEVILVIEAVNHLQHIIGGQTRVLDVRHLVPALVAHRCSVDDEPVGLGVVVKLCAGICMGYRHLNGLDIERLCKVDRIPN